MSKALDILKETGTLGGRHADFPIEQKKNIQLLPKEGDLVDDPGRYRRLVGK